MDLFQQAAQLIPSKHDGEIVQQICRMDDLPSSCIKKIHFLDVHGNICIITHEMSDNKIIMRYYCLSSDRFLDKPEGDIRQLRTNG